MDFSSIAQSAFVLDEKLLRKNLELMRHVQNESGAKIILAFKGFAMWSAFPMVRQYLQGATASSLFEARLCFEEMHCLAHTYSAAYAPSEFKEMMAHSGHFSFNSIRQFEQFYPQTLTAAHPITCGIRVNPEFSVVENDLYNPAVVGSRLGELRENFKNGLPKGCEGLHIHALCESSAADTEGLIAAVEEKFGDFLPQLQWINFGGGHLMTRADYDVPRLIHALKSFKQRHPHLTVWLEPGSAVAWQTGVLLARVLDIHT